MVNYLGCPRQFKYISYISIFTNLPNPETPLALPHEVLVLLHDVHLGDGDVKLPLDVEAADHQLASHAPHHQQPGGPTQVHSFYCKSERRKNRKTDREIIRLKGNKDTF